MSANKKFPIVNNNAPFQRRVEEDLYPYRGDSNTPIEMNLKQNSNIPNNDSNVYMNENKIPNIMNGLLPNALNNTNNQGGGLRVIHRPLSNTPQNQTNSNSIVGKNQDPSLVPYPGDKTNRFSFQPKNTANPGEEIIDDLKNNPSSTPSLNNTGTFYSGDDQSKMTEQSKKDFFDYFGKNEALLGLNLLGNNDSYNQLMKQTANYNKQTPSTYVDSLKTETPIGNSIYDLERVNRNNNKFMRDNTKSICEYLYGLVYFNKILKFPIF